MAIDAVEVFDLAEHALGLLLDRFRLLLGALDLSLYILQAVRGIRAERRGAAERQERGAEESVPSATAQSSTPRRKRRAEPALPSAPSNGPAVRRAASSPRLDEAQCGDERREERIGAERVPQTVERRRERAHPEDRAGQTLDRALEEEGDDDEGVGGSDEPQHLDLVLARESGEPRGIADHQERAEAENRRPSHPRPGEETNDGREALAPRRLRVHRVDAVEAAEARRERARRARIEIRLAQADRDDRGKHFARIDPLEDVRVFPERAAQVSQSLFRRHEPRSRHLRLRLDPSRQSLGRGRRQATLREHENRVTLPGPAEEHAIGVLPE